MIQKYSLFLLETQIHSPWNDFKDCFEYLETYDTLEEAQIAQKELKPKSIILPSY